MVLHNISIDLKMPDLDRADDEDYDESEDNHNDTPSTHNHVRDHSVNTHFSASN